MKLLIALAAMLSSAALTVPTVTDLGDTNRDPAVQIAASSSANEKHA